jgi:ABC-type transport system involved in multi-copper enzyme maturation permease subunit
VRAMWWTQILAVMRLEIKKTFFAKRGLWIYLLALAPVALFTTQAIVERSLRMVEPDIPGTARMLTGQQMDDIHDKMTRDEIVAQLGAPVTSSKQTVKKYDEDGKEATVEEETLHYYGPGRALTLILDDGVLNGVISNSRLSFGQNTYIFAGVFQFFFIRLAVFFGCLGIFMNLFRGEMLDKSLHYYLLSPIRREVLLAGKYLAGLLAATVIFTTSTALQLVANMAAFDGNTVSRYLYQEHGLSHIAAYLGVTVLACIGYGSIFLAAGLLFRNPIIAAAIVLVWESANPLLPALLKKFSVIYYLKSLCPVQIPLDPGMPALLAMLVSNGDPISSYVAIFGLLALSVLVLWASSLKVRTLEINYTTE